MDATKFVRTLKPRKLSSLNFPVTISTEHVFNMPKLKVIDFKSVQSLHSGENEEEHQLISKKASHSKFFIPVIPDRHTNFSKYFLTVQKISETIKIFPRFLSFGICPNAKYENSEISEISLTLLFALKQLREG